MVYHPCLGLFWNPWKRHVERYADCSFTPLFNLDFTGEKQSEIRYIQNSFTKPTSSIIIKAKSVEKFATCMSLPSPSRQAYVFSLQGRVLVAGWCT